MNARLVAVLALFLAFTTYSVAVVLGHGYTGFLELAGREPWAMQMLIDLAISLVLFSLWMVPDARKRGITPWPYLPAILTLGSVGALAYLVHRELASSRALARDATLGVRWTLDRRRRSARWSAAAAASCSS